MALVLADTNIIIEAARARVWNAVAGHHTLETVEKCFDEAVAGDRMRPGYVDINANALRQRLGAVHDVSDQDRATLLLKCPDADALDAGERDLFAHLLARTDDWQLCCADRAAVKVACALGWADRIVSLEAITRAAGANPHVKAHFTEAWLSEVRTRFRLNIP